MRKAIISYAKAGREDYPTAMKRLLLSIQLMLTREHHAELGVFLISPDMPESNLAGVPINRSLPGMPEHKDVPYGFKPYMFAFMFEQLAVVETRSLVDSWIKPARVARPKPKALEEVAPSLT